MKIYFSPAYKGHLYINLSDLPNGVAFDTCYKNIDGLYELLATHLGVHMPHYTEGERLASYFGAISAYISSNPGSIIAQSFANAPLSTAKECLRWRDELALYGWSKITPAVSKRLEVLQGIEKEFDCDKGKEVLRREVTNALKTNPKVLNGSEIHVPMSKKILPPAEQQLLDLLQVGGCNVLYEEQHLDYERLLKLKDGFRVWEFKTIQDAMCYLATLPNNYSDCYISKECATLDSWMNLVDGVTSGSKIPRSHTGSCGVLLLGLKTLYQPLDIISLVDWLNLPYHPFPYRYDLSKTIQDEGGYHHQKCKDILDKEECKKFASWLPKVNFDSDKSGPKDITVSKLKEFAQKIHYWAKKEWKKCERLSGQKPEDWSDLIDLCDNFIKILSKYPTENIRQESAEELAFSLIPVKDTTLHHACVDSKEVISSGGCMVDPANVTILCDAYGEDQTVLSCSFLAEKERTALSSYLDLWERDNERDYYKTLMMYPLTHTNKKLILVVCNKDGNTTLNLHPLVIWAKGRLGMEYSQHVDKLSIDTKYIGEQVVVDNSISDNGISLEQHTKIQYSANESPTTLEKLLDSPLDYAMEKLIKIKSSTKDSIAQLHTIKGNVAHTAIEILFGKQDDSVTVDGKTLRARFEKEFDNAVIRALNARGAFLLHRENVINRYEFTTSLKRCVSNLIDIIDANCLEVVACEYKMEDIELGLVANNGEKTPVTGRIDMVLKNSEGDKVIIDLKWSSSYNNYINKITTGTAYQLDLYSAMLHQHEGSIISKSGYFVMPSGRLYTRGSFVGPHVDKVVTHLNQDAVKIIVDNYHQRMKEFGEGWITYKDEDGNPIKSSFTDYDLFYGPTLTKKAKK